MTPEQQRAMALARARRRRAEAESEKQSETGYGRQIAAGLFEGATGALGFPVDAANAAIGLGMHGVNSVFGTDFQPSQEPLGGSAGLRRGLAIDKPSDDVGQQMARRVSQSTGAAAVPLLGAGGTAGQMLSGFGTAAGGGLGAAAMQQIAPGNVGAEILGEVLGSVGAGSAISGIANSLARNKAIASVPEVKQLKSDASDLYARAEKNGVTATQTQTESLAREMRDLASGEGLISPTGRISEAYPKAREAIRLLDDYSQGTMSPKQMQTVRTVLSDAAESVDGPERRIARMMLNQFDDFTAPLAPELAQARGLYHRAMNAGQLEKMRELGEIRAGQFSASGPENAMRTEYRQLDRAIAKGQEGGWSPAEIQAIQDVSRGTTGQNAARNVGKMAPTGPVSAGMTMGVPFMIGNAMGGPGVGSAAAATAAGVGYGGRAIANSMQGRNMEIAELLARSGGKMPDMTNPGVRDAIARALLAESAMMTNNNGVQ